MHRSLIVGLMLFGTIVIKTCSYKFLQRRYEAVIFEGWKLSNYPAMGQGADYKDRIVEQEDRIGRLPIEGFPMGAAAAAHAVAYHVKLNSSEESGINPASLLYCSGFSSHWGAIEDGPRHIPSWLRGIKNCIPGANTLMWWVAKTLFWRQFDASPKAEQPKNSLTTIACGSTIPMIFVHGDDDDTLSVEHALRNYLTAVEARKSVSNIYLLIAHCGPEEEIQAERPHMKPLNAQWWNAAQYCSIGEDGRITKKSGSVGSIVNAIYINANSKQFREFVIDGAQPSPGAIKKALRPYIWRKRLYLVSKLGILAMLLTKCLMYYLPSSVS